MQPDLFSLLPERLVIYGFRNIMAAHDLNDAACWEQAWRHYIGALGPNPARRLMGELQYWARTIRSHAAKPMRYFPCACRHICQDECMAVATIAAAQMSDRSCTELAASHLLAEPGPNALADVWVASSHFAAALKLEGLRLFPVTAEIIASIAALEERDSARSGGTSIH